MLTVPVVWATFGIFSAWSKWFPVGRDWWPWMKPGYITMTQRQSNNQWSGCIAAHPAPKKFWVQKSAGKVLASIFWDQDGILLIDYLPKGQTINAEYYSYLLVQLKDILKEKCHRKVTKGVLFFHGNAPAHWALATRKKLAYLGFQCLDHPPYSPGLTPSDYHLFPGPKKQLKGHHFRLTRSLLPWRPGWTDIFLNFLKWLAKVKSNGLRSVLSFVGSVLNKSRVCSL